VPTVIIFANSCKYKDLEHYVSAGGMLDLSDKLLPQVSDTRIY
jgi:hypothetical protein